jgi:hypothetical protein
MTGGVAGTRRGVARSERCTRPRGVRERGWLALGAAAVLGAASCAPATVTRIDVAAVRDVRVAMARTDGIALELDLDVRSTARAAATVSALDLELALRGSPIGRGRIAGPLLFSPGAITEVTLPLDVEPARVSGDDLEALCGAEVPYRVRGTLTLSAAGRTRTSVLDASGRIRRTGELSVQLDAARLAGSDLVELSAVPVDVQDVLRGRATAALRLRNPFGFDLPLAAFAYRVHQRGTTLADGRLGAQPLASGANELSLPLSVSRASATVALADAALDRLLGRQADPIQVSGRLQLGRPGCLELAFDAPVTGLAGTSH